MDQQNQNTTPDGSGDVPLKRKRGRPRKYPRQDLEESSYNLHSYIKKHNSSSGGQASVPRGFEGVNGNKLLQRNQENDLDDAMVGQAVSGVIEAVFDAGYLLNVRVGDYDTTLRGLVFKPGHYVPISPENDVAPGVPMIPRNEVLFPLGSAQFQTPLPKERNEQHVNVNGSETQTMNRLLSVPKVAKAAVGSSNLVSSLGKDGPPVVAQTTSQLARDNVVPNLLQPEGFSNGVPVQVPVCNQPSPVITHISVGSIASVAKEIPLDGIQSSTSHSQTNQNMLSSGVQNEGVHHHHHHSSSNSRNEETKPAGAPGAPFEHLVTEVVKRMHDSSDDKDTKTDNSKLGDMIQLKNPSCSQVKVSDMGRPILIKPLQAVQSHPQENSATAPTPPDYTKIGKMTELLQVLQDNKLKNQASKTAELGSEHRLDDVRYIGMEKPLDEQNFSEQ